MDGRAARRRGRVRVRPPDQTFQPPHGQGEGIELPHHELFRHFRQDRVNVISFLLSDKSRGVYGPIAELVSFFLCIIVLNERKGV